MKKKINVLFTSAGRRVELLQAFRRAYTALKLEGNLAGSDVDPLAPALQVVDYPCIVPLINSTDYIPALIKICRQVNIDLVFPLIDPDIQVLAEHRSQIEATGARLILVDEKAATITGDKWLTNQFFLGLDLAVPFSWRPEDIPSDIEFPLFLKPRQGSASKNAHLVANREELDFFLTRVTHPIVQRNLSGPEITSDVICGLDGQVQAVVSRQRLEVRWGEVHKGVTVYNQEVAEACVKVAKTLKAIGPITVQCIMHENRPHFTEINPRFGGGCPLGIAAGVDSPRWLLAQAAGLPVEIPPLGTYQKGLFLTRYDNSFFVSEQQRASLASHNF